MKNREGKFGPGLLVAAAFIGPGTVTTASIAGARFGFALGLQSISGIGLHWWALLVGLVAGGLLASGTYAQIEKLLVGLVIMMSMVFLLTLFMVRPPVGAMLKGLLVPSLPPGSLLTVIALIGTTVVPYNLFLHASAVQEKWPASKNRRQSLREARTDTAVSIGLGGLITVAIMSTSAVAFFGRDGEFSAISMSQQLEPLLGVGARYFFAAGLFAAGLSSAVTAPLAAAYAVCGVLGWSQSLRSKRFTSVWLAVLLCGTGFSVIGIKPLAAILFAQAANGFLLPFCAIFLLLVMNRRDMLGAYVNRPLVNALGAMVVLITVALGLIKIQQVFSAL